MRASRLYAALCWAEPVLVAGPRVFPFPQNHGCPRKESEVCGLNRY